MSGNRGLNQLLMLALKRGFTLVCIFATLITAIWQFYTYGKGEDQTQVEYKHFNEAESDIYPSIALCVTTAVNEERLKEYGANFTAEQYVSFLQGKHWDQSMLKVDYENVIKKWDKNILWYGYSKYDVNTFVQTVPLYTSKEIDPTSSENLPGFKEISLFGGKCLTLDILFKKGVKLINFMLFFKPEIFLRGNRPSQSTENNPFLTDSFIFVPHYPKQFIRNLYQGLIYWPARGTDAPKSYAMHFRVRGIEVLERRNKYRKPCGMKFPDLDSMIRDSVLKEISCKPPFWNSSSSLPLCSNQETMKNATNLISKLLYDDANRATRLKSLPCRGLEKIQYDLVDEDFPSALLSVYPELNGSPSIYFEFTESTYKELKHVRNMDIQALIGNRNNQYSCCNYILFLSKP